MKFENGYYKDREIVTRHPRIVKSVIIGKKSWGLWIGEWSDGISEGLFIKNEIVNEFVGRGVKIPENLMKDFNYRIRSKFIKRYR